MPTRAKHLPNGIKLQMSEVREQAKHLKSKGWVIELKRLHNLAVQLKLGWPTLDFKIEKVSIEGWEGELIRSAPIAQLVGPEAKKLELPKYVLPAIVINLDAPDDVVRKNFEEKLREARQQYPFPFEKPGRKSNDSNIPWPDTFMKWCDYNILPLATFIIWRSAYAEQDGWKYTDVMFAEWAGMDKNKVSYAKKVLFRAIYSLPLLNYALRYIQDEDDLSDESRKLAQTWTPYFEARANACEEDG